MNWPRLHDRPADEPPLLHDRYTVGSPIGQGRATVYRGTDTRLGRTVALKRVALTSDHESGERVHRRALREARAAARLDHPSVVTVYDVVEEDDALWLVMELVEAPSLAQLVTEEGGLDHPRAARIGRDVLGALVAAHHTGVVHRDVKPANVLVPPTGPAKLADFGVASVRDETRVTATGLVLGSPAYMAPEQARGEEADPAADLWSLGATLYFAYEGEPPFDGATALATASAVVHGEPRPERRPGPLSPLVARLLAKPPAARPPADEIRATLRRIAGPGPAASPAPEVGSPAPAITATLPIDAVDRTPASGMSRASGPAAESPVAQRAWPRGVVARLGHGRAGRTRVAWLVVVAAMIVAALVALALLTNRDASPSQDSAGQVEDRAATTTTPPTTAAPDPSGSGGGAGAGQVPAGWHTYTDRAARYTIAYPSSWQVERAGGHRTDFRDPESGSYLRVDWSNRPKADPVADWRTQAQGFAASHQDYEEIAIAPYDYRDYEAARWEFRYSDGGARLHAFDLNVIAGDNAYALFFQTQDENWSASQDVFAQLRESFRPAGG